MAETLFHCDDALWHRFAALCRARDETPGAVLRDLVRLEVKRHESRKARSDEVIVERLAFGSSSLRRWRRRRTGRDCRPRSAAVACASSRRAAG